jgi:hypothetical protein
MLKGRELAPEDDEQSVDGLGNLFAKPEPIGYNPSFQRWIFAIGRIMQIAPSPSKR